MFRIIWKKIIWFLKRNNLKFVSYNDSKIMHYARHGRFDLIRKEEIKFHHLNYRNRIKESFLRLCIESGLNEIVEYIIKKYPMAMEEVNGEYDNNLLMNSVEFGNSKVFELLLKLKPNLNYINKRKEHILSFTARNSNLSNILFNQTIQLTQLPIEIRKQIILSYSQTSIPEGFLVSLIRNNITKDFPTKEICSVLKCLLMNYKYSGAEEILKEDNFLKTLELKDEELLFSHKEGFVNNKLLIKSFQYSEEFNFHGYKLTNFHKTVGINNKDNAKLFYKNLLKQTYSFLPSIVEINTSMINSVYFIKKHFNIDENVLKPVITSQNGFKIVKSFEKKLATILNHYSNTRIIQIIANGSSEVEIRDTVYMYELILKYCSSHKIDIKLFLSKKPRKMKDIHDSLQVHLSKIGRDNIPINLEMPNYILNMNNRNFLDYSIKIPKSNSELVIVGQNLAICVGNNYYARQMASGRIAIILLCNKRNKVEYCIEYDVYLDRLNQSKTYYNTEMNKSLKDDLYRFIEDSKRTN